MSKLLQFPDSMLLRAEWGGRQDPLDQQIDSVWECWEGFNEEGDFLANTWYLLDNELVPLPTIEDISKVMTKQYRQDSSSLFAFTQNTYSEGPDAPPTASMSLQPARPRGGRMLVANQVVVRLQAGMDGQGEVVNHLPTKWLLDIGTRLVTTFINVWHPDMVSLDCGALMRVPHFPDGPYPVVGFVSWLSDSVVDHRLLPDAPIKQRYNSGTIIGICPDSPDPLKDAIELAESVYQAGILSMIPFVQGQPNPPLGASK